MQALYSKWSDFEDAVQACAADVNSVDVIVTRNKKDFVAMETVQVLTPAEFLRCGLFEKKNSNMSS